MRFILDHPQIIIAIVAAIVVGVGKIWELIKPKEPAWQPPREEDSIPADSFEPAPAAVIDYAAMLPPPLPQFAVEPEFERQRKMLERLKMNRASEAVAAVKTNAKMKVKAPQLVSPSKVRASLRDKNQVRRAIVMREILGPPASLK